MGGIGVITNPRSRRNKRNPRLAQNLAYMVGGSGELAQPTDLGELDATCEDFLEREIEILAINGGDGTNHVVLSAMCRVYGERPLPKIAMLRGGTMNTVSSGLGMRGAPEALLGRLIGAHHSGQPIASVQRSLLHVGEHAGFIFGNGLISNFLELYYEGSDPSPAKAARLLARAVGSAMVRGPFIDRIVRPMRCRVTVGQRRWPDLPWGTITAATVEDIGLGFRPFYKAPSHPGYLHAVGIGCTPVRLAWQLQRIWRALPTTDPEIVDDVTDRLVIEADEPLNYMIDGDFHRGGQRLEVRVGQAVTLLLP